MSFSSLAPLASKTRKEDHFFAVWITLGLVLAVFVLATAVWARRKYKRRKLRKGRKYKNNNNTVIMMIGVV